MENNIDKKSVGTLAAVFYVAMKAIEQIIPKEESVDQNKLATMVTNKTLTHCIKEDDNG